MKIHSIPHDYDYSFARGLTTFGEYLNTTQLEPPVENICVFLKENYLFPVEYVSSSKGHIYVKVPEHTSETIIGWIDECIKYVCPVGVEVKVIESNEDKEVLSSYIEVTVTIKRELNGTVKYSKNILQDNKGIPCAKQALEKALDDLVEREILDCNFDSPISGEVKQVQLTTQQLKEKNNE